MAKPSKRAVRTFDFTAVPEGPHGEFPRQLVETLDSLVGTTEELEERVAQAASADTDLRLPRVKSVQETADPFEISPDPAVHKPGTVFDDVSAAGALSIQLPALEDMRPFYDLDTEIPWFGFLNTSAQAMTILAGTDTTIAVGPGADGASSFKLATQNDFIILRLIDDRWRGP